MGLRLSSGEMIGIGHINAVRTLNGETWLDVELLDQTTASGMGKITSAPTSRLTASVNVRHIMYAVELADT